MRVTSKGQVTIPKSVREALGIKLAESEVEFVQDESGRWYLRKRESGRQPSRFRQAHEVARPRMTSEELLALTRGD